MGRLRAVILLFSLILAGSCFAQQPKDAKAIYDSIESFDTLRAMKLRDAIKGDVKKLDEWVWCVDDTQGCKAQIDRIAELSNLGGSDPAAAFYSGLLDLKSAQSWAARGNLSDREQTDNDRNVESMSATARKKFIFASSAGIPAAMWNLGIIYSTGLGVAGSKLAAIEWYGRAGIQYLKDGERETALAALEKMESLDAKHQDCVKLRAALYPAVKKKRAP